MKVFILYLGLICLYSIKSTEFKRIHTFKDIFEEVKNIPVKTISVAFAQDYHVLYAIKVAEEQQITKAILVGDEEKIKKIAKEIDFDLSNSQIINELDKVKAARIAVKLVHDGKADMYMKGILDTKSFLQSLLDKEIGLRTGKDITLITLIEMKKQNKLYILTDPSFIPYPTLKQKVSIINYATKAMHYLGVKMPKVAPLAALEFVNPKISETVEAAELMKMNEEGKITGCIIDGPLSLDLATDPNAAKHKGAEGRKIVGDADVLLVHNVHAGNVLYKTLSKLVEIEMGSIVVGAVAPVILTSRADDFRIKVNSIALAAYIAEMKEKDKENK